MPGTMRERWLPGGNEICGSPLYRLRKMYGGCRRRAAEVFGRRLDFLESVEEPVRQRGQDPWY